MRRASSIFRVMGRPAARPPTCELVRPPQIMTRSLPRVSMRFFWSALKPRPRPTSRITDAMPQMIPNIVRKLRILWARRVASVCFRMSSRFMVSAPSAGRQPRSGPHHSHTLTSRHVVPNCRQSARSICHVRSPASEPGIAFLAFRQARHNNSTRDTQAAGPPASKLMTERFPFSENSAGFIVRRNLKLV